MALLEVSNVWTDRDTMTDITFAGPRPPEYPQTFEVDLKNGVKFRYTVEDDDTVEDIQRKVEAAWREAIAGEGE